VKRQHAGLNVLMVICAACASERIDPSTQPGKPLSGLTDLELGSFLVGQAVFERIATPEEGLGPFFNAERCSACHDEPAVGGTGALLVVKATAWDGQRCDLLETEGGDNIRQRATPRMQAHGRMSVPVPAGATATSRVTSPPLFGLGLIEAIADADLIAGADPEDVDGDGVRGRAPLMPDGSVARFGRKGETSTIADFVDTALRFEMGLTTPLFPDEAAAGGRDLPDGVDPMGEPEIEQNGVDLLAAFSRFLAPPARAQAQSRAHADSVAAGERIFGAIGCDRCHAPELRTGRSPTPALDRKPVRAYSDFLLHDLGPEMASVCGVRAGPSEWRTAPLWGLRYRSRFLHDGRAADVERAIAAHGGEAERSRRAFDALGPSDRARLLAFLRSL
jgi:CxxC motif-containing protein (DUF1111 family)